MRVSVREREIDKGKDKDRDKDSVSEIKLHDDLMSRTRSKLHSPIAIWAEK